MKFQVTLEGVTLSYQANLRIEAGIQKLVNAELEALGRHGALLNGLPVKVCHIKLDAENSTGRIEVAGIPVCD